VVKVDGTWLYSKYKGMLLVAVAIVFVAVESKITEAWLFSLQNLKRHVTLKYGLCLILDM